MMKNSTNLSVILKGKYRKRKKMREKRMSKSHRKRKRGSKE